MQYQNKYSKTQHAHSKQQADRLRVGTKAQQNADAYRHLRKQYKALHKQKKELVRIADSVVREAQAELALQAGVLDLHGSNEVQAVVSTGAQDQVKQYKDALSNVSRLKSQVSQTFLSVPDPTASQVGAGQENLSSVGDMGAAAIALQAVTVCLLLVHTLHHIDFKGKTRHTLRKLGEDIKRSGNNIRKFFS